MEGKIIFGSNEIVFRVKFANRKTLGIKVYPSGNVEVLAPIDTTIAAIEQRVYRRVQGILRQQNYFKELGERSPDKRFISGESHYYLGRQFLLRVEESKPNSVRHKGRYFEVICTPKSKAKELMKEWYRIHAKCKFAEYAEPIIARFEKYGVTPTSLHIQEMENRWGSCTPKGKIILNTRLIMAPQPCIEYVITHELCHLLHPDHTKAFWDLLQKEMPDWERWKNKLERFML
jgi:predicted metal-dependent hydrolase